MRIIVCDDYSNDLENIVSLLKACIIRTDV